jgi:hypothetical protein
LIPRLILSTLRGGPPTPILGGKGVVRGNA